jgi:hypothetical protein
MAMQMLDEDTLMQAHNGEIGSGITAMDIIQPGNDSRLANDNGLDEFESDLSLASALV